jgi:uncharacterized protein
MDITPLVPAGRKIIQAYGDGGFRVAGERFEGALLVLTEQVARWGVEGMDALADSGAWASLEPVVGATPPVELLILGTGARHEMVPPWLRRQLSEVGIGVETMATGAACRTFNLLLTEGRRVAAALLPVP